MFFKKNDRPYPKSFSKRLTWRITLVMFIVMALASYLLYEMSYQLIVEGSELTMRYVLKSEKQSIHSTISEIKAVSVNTVPQIEENLDKPEKLHAIMKQMVELNPAIQSCGLSFVENYYPGKGHQYCPYAYRKDTSEVVVKTLGDKDHDYLHETWFKKALASEEGYWAKPFFDDIDHTTPLVPWVMPIHDHQGKAIAVLGVDLALQSLREELSVQAYKEKIFEGLSSQALSVYNFAITKDGTYLVHPDSARVIKENYFTYCNSTSDSSDDELGRKMRENDEGDLSSVNIDDEDLYVRYRAIPDTDWSIAIVCSNALINGIASVLGVLLALFFMIPNLLVVIFMGRHFVKKAAKPIQQLAASADEVAKGNFKAPLPPLKTRDEIHQLRDSFEKMQLSLTRYMEELKTTTAAKASIESELKIAHDIQMSMLPKTFPPYPERDDIDIYGSLTPAKDVGGDLFDFYIREEQLVFCVGDVSGKGVPASLVMAVTRSLFRNVSAHVLEPNKIVYAINNALTDGNDTEMFVTLFVGVLDLQTGHLRYSNAGHNAPVLMADSVSEIPCDSNLPAGVMDNWDFSLQELDIRKDDVIFIYTDGLNEAEDACHQLFGEERMLKQLKQQLAVGQTEPQAIIEEMGKAVHTFASGTEQSDDLTMLAIKYKKNNV